MKPINQRELWAAIRACNRAAALHLFDPNVWLIDVGLRIKERQGKEVTDRLTVRAHLHHKLRGAAFETFAATHPRPSPTAGELHLLVAVFFYFQV